MTVPVVVMIIIGFVLIFASYVISESLAKKEENFNADLLTVKDDYEFNKKLIDMNEIPEEFKNYIDGYIISALRYKPNKFVSFKLSDFLTKWDLNNLNDISFNTNFLQFVELHKLNRCITFFQKLKIWQEKMYLQKKYLLSIRRFKSEEMKYYCIPIQKVLYTA